MCLVKALQKYNYILRINSISENPDRIMIPKLIQNSEKIDCIITQTPTEALILERELIRKHKPKYNSRLNRFVNFYYYWVKGMKLKHILFQILLTH